MYFYICIIKIYLLNIHRMPIYTTVGVFQSNIWVLPPPPPPFYDYTVFISLRIIIFLRYT